MILKLYFTVLHTNHCYHETSSKTELYSTGGSPGWSAIGVPGPAGRFGIFIFDDMPLSYVDPGSPNLGSTHALSYG